MVFWSVVGVALLVLIVLGLTQLMGPGRRYGHKNCGAGADCHPRHWCDKYCDMPNPRTVNNLRRTEAQTFASAEQGANLADLAHEAVEELHLGGVGNSDKDKVRERVNRQSIPMGIESNSARKNMFGVKNLAGQLRSEFKGYSAPVATGHGPPLTTSEAHSAASS